MPGRTVEEDSALRMPLPARRANPRPSEDTIASRDASSMPCTTAATAATAAIPFDVMLLRRVTRWVGLKVPSDTEWAWTREFECLAGMFIGVAEDMGRCWLSGRLVRDS